MIQPVLSLRQLNRATLARQLLLKRVRMPATAMLEHLLGLQAQEPDSWYTGFWSRLERFDPEEVSGLLAERHIVRIPLMRSTIHLVTTTDALTLRPLMQPAVAKPMTGSRRGLLDDLGAEEVASATRELLSQEPLTSNELGTRLAERWPECSPSDLAMAARVVVPLVQTPPRGLWRQAGGARHLPLESWVGQPLAPGSSADELVLRYLAAFGPATPADAQAWCGLTRLREVFERLRPQLITFRDERGRELFDLPDAPRPDAETPAPPRFLYDYDNVLLAHAVRTRFGSAELRAWLLNEIGMYSYGTLLVDGFVSGIWRIEREPESATLVVKLTAQLSDKERAQVAEEGEELLRFWAEGVPQRRPNFVQLEAPA